MISAWNRGVREYAAELLEQARENGVEGVPTAKQLLNGAEDWREYSFGGYSLIYDRDICARLATPPEQRAKQGGLLAPNKHESWLDVQARALRQACALITSGEYSELPRIASGKTACGLDRATQAVKGDSTDTSDLDTIKENKKFPQHRFRVVVAFVHRPAKVAYFMAQYRAKEWAERARVVAGDRFAGYQITERISEHHYIHKESKQR